MNFFCVVIRKKLISITFKYIFQIDSTLLNLIAYNNYRLNELHKKNKLKKKNFVNANFNQKIFRNEIEFIIIMKI